MKVLITGGAGFIGSTVASALSDAGHVPVILDDLSSGVRAFTAGRLFYEGDMADSRLLESIFSEQADIGSVLHCAGSIVVPESVRDPLRYYRNNVAKTIALVEQLNRLGCRRFVFSSSAAIYLPGADLTVDENSEIAPASPYAATKAMAERILADAAAAGVISALSLRYFNPVGADPQRRTGLQIVRPTHALGKLIEAYETNTPFYVTGTDWPTRDGSAIRDYIHVWDLARAHVAALERFGEIVNAESGYEVINVGTGTGTTVRELFAAFRSVVNREVDVREGPRRPGDTIGCYTRVEKARRLLQWMPGLSIASAVRDAIEWAEIRDQVIAGRAPRPNNLGRRSAP